LRRRWLRLILARVLLLGGRVLMGFHGHRCRLLGSFAPHVHDDPKRVRKGVRLAIRKAPKVEVPASVYSRKRKHKRPAPPDE